MTENSFTTLNLNKWERDFLEQSIWKSLPNEVDYIISIPEEIVIYFKSLLTHLDTTSETIYKDFSDLNVKYKSSSPVWVQSWLRSLEYKITYSPLFFVVRWWDMLGLNFLKQKLFYLWIWEYLWMLDYQKWPFYEVYDRWGTYDKHQRYSDTRLSLGYHTDSTQKDNLPKYIWLLCIEQSRVWWESKLLNMSNIYRTMMNDFLLELKILQTKYFRDSTKKENAYPVFEWMNGKLVFRYMRRWIEIGYESLGMTLPPEKKEAIDVLENCMVHEAFPLEFKMQVGDILFFDNTILAHDRTEFDDDWISKRLLIRTWVYSAI